MPGGIFLRAYQLQGGESVGWYSDQQIAVVDHSYEKGRTRLIGTFPGASYFRHLSPSSRHFFARLLAWAGKRQHVSVSESGVVARLHQGKRGTTLWVVNHNRVPLNVQAELSPQWGTIQEAQGFWGEDHPEVDGSRIRMQVGERDAAVLRLAFA